MLTTLEICIDNASGLQQCLKGGADRIELCSALSLGGLTPSLGLMQAGSATTIPTYAMIRPRGGDFCFDGADVRVMLGDISAAIGAGLDGVVLGAATGDHMLDLSVLSLLCRASEGVGRTLHRVIDTLADPLEAIDQACDLGFERILTSGGAQGAAQATSTLKVMQDHADGRIEIMAGSGISAENVSALIRDSGLWSFHASCSIADPASNVLIKMGFARGDARRTDAATIQALKNSIARAISGA